MQKETISADTISTLQKFETFKDLPTEQLEWFINESTIRSYDEGEYLFKPDEAMDYTHVILSGTVKVLFTQGKQQRELYKMETGDIGGTLPYSRATVARAHGLVSKNAVILSFPKTKFHDLICNCHELTTRFVHEMTSRVREMVQLQTQNEKMMALGKLSAGLAHELNNPAAAIVRSSSSLQAHLQMEPEIFKKIMAIKMTPEQVDLVSQRLFKRLQSHDRPGLHMTLMERSACEDELVDWFDDHNVDNAGEIAENLVEFGFDEGDFDFFSGVIPSEHLSAVLGWINNNITTEKMVSDIREASNRISDLVSSVKNFTHMDRAGDKQPTNLHDGIRSTLTMLNHKLKKNNIGMEENFQSDLPKVDALISELNQVWTNIIDNAIDALENTPNPTLKISSRQDGDFIKIDFTDNGPGIPDEIKNKIFDPFFTTKEIGKGTGLGLDMVYNIVRQHNGKVTVTSVPGSTNFEVCLPIK